VSVTATGIGSLPGTDFASALRLTLDRLPDFPFLPELPARGPWAGLIGRGLGLPCGLDADLQAGQWRLSGASGIDQRRARATWRDDLDQLEENADGFSGRFKVAIAGPWTLAASLGVAHTGRVLADHGARRDLAQSLAESAAELLSDLRRRLPAASWVLQLEEPSLPAVAAGAVPTPGGFFRHRAVDLPEISAALGAVSAAVRPMVEEVILHSCAPWIGPGAAWPVASPLDRRGAGLSGVSVDVDTLTAADLDALGAAADDGARLYLGVLPTSLPVWSADALTTRTLGLVERLGGPDAAQLVLTPSCGLSGWTPREVSQGLAVLGTVASRVNEEFGA
jgi:hypothetical protein